MTMVPRQIATQYLLPDLLSMLNLPSSLNANYKEVSAESAKWIDDYHTFRDQKRAHFILSNTELLTAMTYPFAPRSKFRMVCDFVNLMFVIDEVADDQTGEEARSTCEMHLKVMRAEPGDESAVARMTKDFRERLSRDVGPRCLKRILSACEEYVHALAYEAELRDHGKILPLDEYRKLRRANSAIEYGFAFSEYALGCDLPDEVFENPILQRMQDAASDMYCWSNDLYSYNNEQAMGHTGFNVVTILMRERQLSLQGAADAIGTEFSDLVRSFSTGRLELPSWGNDVDDALKSYVDSMEIWADGYLKWCFISRRYFGQRLEDVKKTRIVKLKPRQS